MTQPKLKAREGVPEVCKNHELRDNFFGSKTLPWIQKTILAEKPVRSTGAVATGARGSLGNGEGDKEATRMEKKAAMQQWWNAVVVDFVNALLVATDICNINYALK